MLVNNLLPVLVDVCIYDERGHVNSMYRVKTNVVLDWQVVLRHIED